MISAAPKQSRARAEPRPSGAAYIRKRAVRKVYEQGFAAVRCGPNAGSAIEDSPWRTRLANKRIVLLSAALP